jgi:hypothetical protein
MRLPHTAGAVFAMTNGVIVVKHYKNNIDLLGQLMYDIFDLTGQRMED